MKGIRLIDWMLCDDIRQENNGKRIFIGVYDEGIIVPALPATIPQIIFYSKWDTTSEQITKFEFKMIMPNGKTFGPVVTRMAPAPDSPAKRKAVVQLAISPFNMESAGEYAIEGRINDVDYGTIAIFTVSLAAPRPGVSKTLN